MAGDKVNVVKTELKKKKSKADQCINQINKNYTRGNKRTIFYQVTSQLFPLSNTPQLFPAQLFPSSPHSFISTFTLLHKHTAFPPWRAGTLPNLPSLDASPRDESHTPQPPLSPQRLRRYFLLPCQSST